MLAYRCRKICFRRSRWPTKEYSTEPHTLELYVHLGILTGSRLSTLCILGVVFTFLDLIWDDSSVFTGLFVNIAFVPGSLHLGFELVTASAQLSDCLLRQKLLECPLFDVLLLIFLQLRDELNGTLKDRALILLTSGYNLGELVYAFVDGLTAATLDYIIIC